MRSELRSELSIPRVDIIMDNQSLLNYSTNVTEMKITRTLSRNIHSSTNTATNQPQPISAMTMTIPMRRRPQKFLCFNNGMIFF